MRIADRSASGHDLIASDSTFPGLDDVSTDVATQSNGMTLGLQTASPSIEVDLSWMIRYVFLAYASGHAHKYRAFNRETLHTLCCCMPVQVLPGGRIPADGEMLIGSSYINESMISGESEPVLRSTGDPLIGGTINTGNALIMRATRVGADTVLSQIVRLVERAQMSKAPIQAYADYVASLFVPVVVGLALLTWTVW